MHCISIYLTKLSSIVENSDMYEYLNQDIVAFADTNILKSDSLYLEIKTDYFGGFGEQYATLYKNGEIIKEYEDRYHPIDEALKEFGVICEEDDSGEMQDEFDTIHLGRYRDNYDFSFIEDPYSDVYENEIEDYEFKESDLQHLKQVCKCGNDSFRVYIQTVIDDARLFCSKCGEEN